MTWDLLITDTADGTAVAIAGEQIAWVGRASDVPADASPAEVWSAGGRLVTPGLVDCHTHVVFAGDRSAEWEQRLTGESYEAIAATGGGILSTVRATRAASDDELLDAAAHRVARLAAGGVTTIEVKSGYGLDLDTELRMLRIARRIPERVPVDVVTTYLGAHTVPPEFDDPDAYITFVCDEVLPAVAAEHLADAVDGFCERIAFTDAQLDRVFTAARNLGMAVKVHADQLTDSNGAALAARHGAISADHLEHVSPAGIEALRKAGTVAVLLPGAADVPQDTAVPPVDELRSAGIPMAVATDCNPGTSPVLSLLVAARLACTSFGLTVAEAMAGITKQAARALGQAATVGALTPGARADLVVWDAGRPAQLLYWLGGDPVHKVMKRGRFV